MANSSKIGVIGVVKLGISQPTQNFKRTKMKKRSKDSKGNKKTNQKILGKCVSFEKAGHKKDDCPELLKRSIRQV